MYFITHDHQFGFKTKHLVVMCIFPVKASSNITLDTTLQCTHVFLTRARFLIIHADEICLMATTGSAMQNLLDVCHNYGIANDILLII